MALEEKLLIFRSKAWWRKIWIIKIITILGKYSEYEKLGKSSTVEGRNVGTELVIIYAAQEGGMEDAFKLANELLAKQTEPEEKYNAGEIVRLKIPFTTDTNTYVKSDDVHLTNVTSDSRYYEYEFVKVSDNFTPYNYQDLLNIFLWTNLG